jgi:hypothetical protein
VSQADRIKEAKDIQSEAFALAKRTERLIRHVPEGDMLAHIRQLVIDPLINVSMASDYLVHVMERGA